MCTLPGRFVASCTLHSECNVVITSSNSFSYRWLLAACRSFAEHLYQRDDFRTGTHVGLHFDNSVEYLVAFYGILLAGGVVVPIPAHCTSVQLENLCELADIAIVARKPGDKNQANAQSDGFRIATCASYQKDAQSDLLFEFSTGEFTGESEFESAESRPDDLAMLLFTSGTSGTPKAVMLSHRNLIANCDSILSFLPIQKTDKAIALTPFAHALGNSVLQTHVLSGASLVIAGDLSFPTNLLSTMTDYRCTSLTAVPQVFDQLQSVLKSTSQPPPSLRYMAVAGGRMNPQRARDLHNQIAPAEFFLMYGQTEATARLAFLPPRKLNHAAHTIGQAIPGVELQVRDTENRITNVGTVGTLFARGPNIMLGYFNDPTSTSPVLCDGWLNTGDMAKVHKDGLLEICGRQNDLVKIQGHRFHPHEVEQLVASNTSNAQIVVVSFDFFGHTRLAIFGKSMANESLDEAELKAACRYVLPIHMMPQRYEIVHQWPLNSAGKIDRQVLADRFSTTGAIGVSEKQQKTASQKDLAAL